MATEGRLESCDEVSNGPTTCGDAGVDGGDEAGVGDGVKDGQTTLIFASAKTLNRPETHDWL